MFVIELDRNDNWSLKKAHKIFAIKLLLYLNFKYKISSPI